MRREDPFEPANVDEKTFLGVLGEAVAVLDRRDVPALVMGGIASAVLGRERWTRDIDLFVRREDARRGLDALAGSGFRTQKTYPSWLYKGIKRGVLVDLIFCASGEVDLDEEMLERAPVRPFHGLRLRVLPPEDLLVVKVLAHKEELPQHWHDALGLVAAGELDWAYVLRRAAGGDEGKSAPAGGRGSQGEGGREAPAGGRGSQGEGGREAPAGGRGPHRARRVLSLLVYAQSEGLTVPDEVICQLVDRLYVPDEYVVGRLQQAFAHDPRTDELGMRVTASEGTVVLSGTVATAERREAVLAVARDVLGGRAIHDEIAVADLSRPRSVEELGEAGASAPVEGGDLR